MNDTFRLTNWLVSSNGLERRRVKYGMIWLPGNQLPYFSITLEREEKKRNNRWYDAGGGAALEEIAENFPALAPLVKWHLCDQDGTPMHYLANAIFWYEIATGVRECGPRETKESAMKSFRSCAIWTDHVSDPGVSVDVMRKLLPSRLPSLRATFKREMAEADVTFILPTSTRARA